MSGSEKEEKLSELEESIKAELGEKSKKFTKKKWEGVVKEVVWWLYEKGKDEDVLVDTAVGLISYGVTTEEELQNIADNKKEFRETMSAKGIPEAICDLLFEKYVAGATNGRKAGRICDDLLRKLIPSSQSVSLELDDFEMGKNFRADIRVPANPDADKSNPHVLLFDVAREEHKESKVYTYLKETSFKGPAALYGTSGAGKTRSLLEFLANNFGFYFLSDFGQSRYNFGSRDFSHALICASGTVDERTHATKESQEYAIILPYLAMVILVRTKVFLHLQKIGAVQTPYQWMIAQLHPSLISESEDIFLELTREVIKSSSVDILAEMRENLESCQFYCFVDEAQQLLEMSQHSFKSGLENSKVAQSKAKTGESRTMYSAVVSEMSKLVSISNEHLLYPILTGTGHRLESFRDAVGSYTAKIDPTNTNEYTPVFSCFDVLDSKGVEKYLNTFKDFEKENAAIVKHVCNWLVGRPRWSATFVYFWLRGKLSDDLYTAIEKYVDGITKSPLPKNTSEKRWSRSLEKTSAFAMYTRLYSKGNSYDLQGCIERAVLEYSFSGKGVVLDGKFEAVENGFGILAGDDENARIAEPLIVEAGLQYIGAPAWTSKTLASSSRNKSSSGNVFEQWMLPWFQQYCCGTIEDILDCFRMPYDKNMKDKSWSGKWMIRRSAYGVIALDADNETETMEWIRMSQSQSTIPGSIPPFCFPDTGFGPDLMFFLFDSMESATFKYKVCVWQMKFTTKPEKKSKATKEAEKALERVTPEHFYDGYANQRKGPHKGGSGYKPTGWDELYLDLFQKEDSEMGDDSRGKDRQIGVMLGLVMPFRAREIGKKWKLGLCSTDQGSSFQDVLIIVDEKNMDEVFGERYTLLNHVKHMVPRQRDASNGDQ